MTTTDPSPADVVARLRKAVHDGEAYAGTLPAKEAVKLRPKDWHAITGEARRAADLITLLQARAEKAERERDEWHQVARKFVVRTTRAEEALKLIRICEADGERFRFFAHATADVALANKETEND